MKPPTHRLGGLKNRWARCSTHYERCQKEIANWSDADIGRAAAPALIDLGINEPVVWYGGLECTTSEFGEWVRCFLFDTMRDQPEQKLRKHIAERYLLLTENYGLTVNVALTATLLCRLAAIDAFFARAAAFKLAVEKDPSDPIIPK